VHFFSVHCLFINKKNFERAYLFLFCVHAVFVFMLVACPYFCMLCLSCYCCFLCLHFSVWAHCFSFCFTVVAVALSFCRRVLLFRAPLRRICSSFVTAGFAVVVALLLLGCRCCCCYCGAVNCPRDPFRFLLEFLLLLRCAWLFYLLQKVSVANNLLTNFLALSGVLRRTGAPKFFLFAFAVPNFLSPSEIYAFANERFSYVIAPVDSSKFNRKNFRFFF